MTDFRNLRSVEQIAESSKVFTQASLRWLIFHAKTNGFEKCLVRVGRRVLIDEPIFNVWLDEQRERNFAEA